MTLADILALTLATWRVTRFLQHDRGPFSCAMRLRHACGILENETGWVSWPTRGIGSVVACHHCLALWVAGAMIGVWIGSHWPVWFLAAAGGASLLQSWLQLAEDAVARKG